MQQAEIILNIAEIEKAEIHFKIENTEMRKAEINLKELQKNRKGRRFYEFEITEIIKAEIILNIAERIEKGEIDLKIAENTEMRKAEMNLKQLQKNRNERSFYEFEITEIIKAEIIFKHWSIYRNTF